MAENNTPALRNSVDVLIIGAGQAGLALGCHLRQSALRFQIVEANPRLGESWRSRYDSLTLFTPRAYSALPGLPMPGDPEGFPGKDEMAAYLEEYARRFSLPVALGAPIRRLERAGDGFRAATASGAFIEARAVVLATGAFQRPAIPPLSARFSGEVLQLSPMDYKRPGQIPPGAVLIVGDGATGRQIALELSAGHQVLLAASGRSEPAPHRILGKSLFWWMEKAGLLLARADTPLGRALQRRDIFPGLELRLPALRRKGVRVLGRLTGAAGRRAVFAGGETAEVDAVIWATGYADKSDWVAIPAVTDSQGNFVQRSGLSPAPGLYFIGRTGQRTLGSSRIYGVGADALALARRIAADLAAQPVAAAVPAPAAG